MRSLLTILLLILSMAADAQTTRPWEQLFGEMSTFEDMETAEWEDTYELLCDLEQAPLDINTSTPDDLRRLPFLSEQQIEDIMAYLYQYGTMRTVGELAMIESLDYNTRCLLTYFITCGEVAEQEHTDWSRALTHGHHEALVSAGIPFYKRRGDDEVYLGYQYSHSVRYNYLYANLLKVGVVGSQDAGEPFFANENKWGYDYYSFYAEAHRLGRLSTVVAGRMKAAFGLGLVMSNNFSMGKLASLSNLGRHTEGFRGHASRQANYLQGAAATVDLGRGLSLSAFLSYRKVDATLNKDSTAATLLTTDLHRTPTEMAKKNNTAVTTAGGHLGYHQGALRIGVTALHDAVDRRLQPDTTVAYRQYYPAGKRFWNLSADYSYTGPLVSVRGETATGDCGALATLNTLTVTPSTALSLMALYRFYGKKYYSLHANSFSEGGRIQNESGLYLGARWRPWRDWLVTAYTDWAYFPSAKYQALVSSQAWDNLAQVQYAGKLLTVSMRYRLKIREYDNSEMTALIKKTTQRMRLDATLHQGDFDWGMQADVAHSHFEQNSVGWMVNAYAAWQHKAVTAKACVGYFKTDDSESRIYGYEPGILYSYGYRSYDGEGIHYALLLRADLGRRWMLAAHLSVTDYFDRDHISSGYQQINRSSKTDLALQLRMRF